MERLVCSKELRAALDIAFQGCGISLEEALASQGYASALTEASARPRYQHECLVFSCTEHVRESREMYAEGRPVELPYWGEPVQPISVPPSQVAIMQVLGEGLISCARRECLTPEMRQLAAEWRACDEQGLSGRACAKRLYRLIGEFRRPVSGAEEDVPEDSDPRVRELYRLATWWVFDRQHQAPELMLPRFLATDASLRPNCQGASLLACAFAAEAGVPSYRVNLLSSSKSLGETLIFRQMAKLVGIFSAIRWLDLAEARLALNYQALCMGIASQVEPDFHSSCAIRCAGEWFTVDPYAGTIYQTLDDPFSDGVPEMAGSNVLVTYLEAAAQFMEGSQRDGAKFEACFRSLAGQLDGLKGICPSEVLTCLLPIACQVMELNSQMREGDSYRYDPERQAQFRQETLGWLEKELCHEGATAQEMIRDFVNQILGVATLYFEDMKDLLDEQLVLLPPVACEYSEAAYATGVTTVQAMLVQNGSIGGCIDEIAGLACDQSVLYLLAGMGLEKIQAGEDLGELQYVALRALLQTDKLCMHPATMALVPKV